MKLKRVTKNDPMLRLAVSIPTSCNNILLAYQDFYKSTTGDEIPMGLLVEQILREYTEEDKEFAKFLKTWKTPEKEASKSGRKAADTPPAPGLPSSGSTGGLSGGSSTSHS